MKRAVTNTASKWVVPPFSAIATLGAFWMAAGAPLYAK